MGFFDRLYDFGDREMVRAYAMRVGTGLLQLKSSSDKQWIKGLSSAVAKEVQNMLIQADKLTSESKSCLKITYNGNKIPYYSFLEEIHKTSVWVIENNGYPLI